MTKIDKLFAGVIGIWLLLFFAASCSLGTIDDSSSFGTLRIYLGGDTQGMSVVTPKAITGVDQVVVNLIHIDGIYSPIRATASWPPGDAIAVNGIRIGSWLLQVSLVDGATGATKYYGQTQVDIEPGDNGSVTVMVYATGFGDIGIVEGLLPPAIEVIGEPDFENSQVDLHINPTNDIPFYYSIGAESDPFGETLVEDPAGVDVLGVGFDEVVRAVSYDGTPDPALYSEILDFIFNRPFTYPGPTTYDQPAYVPLAVTLHTSIPGATLRYSLNGTPTYDFGLLAGDGTTIVLEESTTLQLVSFMPGDPESVSEVTVAEYVINYVGGDILILVNGEPAAPEDTIDFGFADPEIEGDPVEIVVRNNGAEPLTLSAVTPSIEFDTDFSGPAVIPPGVSSSFVAYFEPAAAGPEPIEGTLTLTSDDPNQGTFLLNLTGIGNEAPELTLLTGVGIYDAGTPEANGLYLTAVDPEDGVSTTHDGEPLWQNPDTGYYLYFSDDYSYWLIGQQEEAVLPTYEDGMFEYCSNDYEYSPAGWGYDPMSGYWEWDYNNGEFPPPFVYEVNGIFGRPDLVSFTGMVADSVTGEGKLLTVVYDETDADDPTDTPLYQWYFSTSETGPAYPIEGATYPYYRTSWDDNRLWLYAVLTPKSVSGTLLGEEVITPRVLISDNHDNYFFVEMPIPQ